MRKFLFAPILSVLLVATVVFGANFFMKPAKADIQPAAATACNGTIEGVLCIETTGGRLKVTTLAGVLVVDQPLPRVTVGGPTIQVTLPRVTVTRPPLTVTVPRVRTLPGQVVTLPRQTVTVELPGATTTATLPGRTMTVPGPTTTVSGQTVTTTPTVVPVTITASNGQRIQTSVTITASPLPGIVTTTPVVKEKKVRVSVPTAVSIGVGALLLGLILGLLAIYAAYTVGYKDSEDAEQTRWRKFRAELFGKKDEGES